MKAWQETSVKLGVIATALTLVGILWAAGHVFETKEAHKEDMRVEREFMQVWSEKVANDAADKAVEKWVRLRRGP